MSTPDGDKVLLRTIVHISCCLPSPSFCSHLRSVYLRCLYFVTQYLTNTMNAILVLVFLAFQVVSADFCLSCESAAATAVSCSFFGAEADLGCVCSQTSSFLSYVSSCIASSTYGCNSDDWSTESSFYPSACVQSTAAAASSSIAASTSSVAYYSCGACYSSAVALVNCVDDTDSGCLCPTSNQAAWRSKYMDCASSNSCFGEALSDNLVYFSSVCASGLGCPLCQSQVATGLSCEGNEDYRCLCTQADAYLSLVSNCANSYGNLVTGVTLGFCSSDDAVTARNILTSACDILSTGGVPIVTGTSVFASPSSHPSQAAHKSPDAGAIAGAVIGSIAAIALLAVGGYFIFRKRKHRATAHQQSRNENYMPPAPMYENKSQPPRSMVSHSPTSPAQHFEYSQMHGNPQQQSAQSQYYPASGPPAQIYQGGPSNPGSPGPPPQFQHSSSDRNTPMIYSEIEGDTSPVAYRPSSTPRAPP